MRCKPTPPKAIRFLALASVLASAAVSRGDSPPYLLRLGVPDFDQVWGNLPNDGKMYCVPTAYANIFKYFDENGLPQLSPIQAHTSNGYEDSIVNHLDRLGELMETDPTDGTSGDIIYDTAKEWIQDRAPETLMYHYYYGPDWNWGTWKIRKVLSSGSMARIGYGRYRKAVMPYSSLTTWYRAGGHAVVCIGYDYIYDDAKYLMVNDPATGGTGIFTQSPMMYDFKRTENLTLFTLEYGEIAHARYTMATGENNDKRNLIDSMHQIAPLYTGWFETAVVTRNAAAAGSSSIMSKGGDPGNGKYHGDGSVRVVIPWQPTDQRGEIPNEYKFTPRENMVDWILAMGELSAYYVTHLGRVFHVDLETGEHKLLHVLKGAKRILESGSTMDLYVLVEGKKGDQIVRLEKDGKGMDTHELPFRAAAMEHDPETGGPAVLDHTLTQVYSLQEDMVRHTTTTIPRVGDGPGEVIFRIDHNTGDILTTRKGAFEFNRYSRRLGSDLPMRQAPNLLVGIAALVPTENGLVAVQDGQMVATYDRFGIERRTQLSGLRAVGELKLTRSHVAAKPQHMVGAAWRNLWPIED